MVIGGWEALKGVKGWRKEKIHRVVKGVLLMERNGQSSKLMYGEKAAS